MGKLYRYIRPYVGYICLTLFIRHLAVSVERRYHGAYYSK